jgi:hypothetical protein
MIDLRVQLFGIVQTGHPMTVRQVFYQAVNHGLIRKTETEYKRTIVRLLAEMRRDGELPFGWIADNTRWMRKPRTHASLDGFLTSAAQHYRRALWDDQDDYVEIWLEKDALSGVVYNVTAPWDVPLMVTRGYPSITYLHDAAESIEAEDKPAYLYYFGDYDPSGVDIPRKVEADLATFAPGAEIHFEVVAVTPWQINVWSLPTRPTKQTDTRSKGFAGDSVEVDAIPPDTLRQLVSECITGHIDQNVLDLTKRIEASERDILTNLSQGLITSQEET